MNYVTVLLLQRPWYRDACGVYEEELIALTRKNLDASTMLEPRYVPKIVGISDKFEGEQAADEIFDMTNNPGRQSERDQYFADCRSLSVGDVVIVDDVIILCCSFGWKRIELNSGN